MNKKTEKKKNLKPLKKDQAKAKKDQTKTEKPVTKDLNLKKKRKLKEILFLEQLMSIQLLTIL